MIAGGLITAVLAAVTPTPSVEPDLIRLGDRPVTLTYALAGPVPTDVVVTVRDARSRRQVRRWVLPEQGPGVRRLRWDGRTARGLPAPNGRYEFRVATDGGASRRAGRFTLRSRVFPVRGATSRRGAIGEFGAPRNGGRIHHGIDIVAPCGRRIVAAQAGRVRTQRYDPVLYGNLVIVRDARARRDWWYSHLQGGVRVRRGQRVATGQVLGRVGDTGNARSVGCHLHYETHVRGRPVDPRRFLSR